MRRKVIVAITAGKRAYGVQPDVSGSIDPETGNEGSHGQDSILLGE